jgi:small conductance mechanosensitive channel
MDTVRSTLSDAGFELAPVLRALVICVIILAGAWLFGGWLRRRLQRSLSAKSFGRNGAILIGRLSSMAVFTVAFVAILGVLGVNSTGLLAFLGAFTVALGLSLQDVFKNFFSGVFLLMERPFRVGDIIKVRDVEGEVMGIDVRTTQVRIHDESVVMIPNSVMFTDVLTNRSRAGWRRFDLSIEAKGRSVLETERLVHETLGPMPGVAKPIASPNVVSASRDLTRLDISLLVEARTHLRQDIVEALVNAAGEDELTVTQS